MVCALLSLDDDLQAARVSWTVPLWLGALESHQVFWRAEDLLLHYVLRAAKRSALLAQVRRPPPR